LLVQARLVSAELLELHPLQAKSCRSPLAALRRLEVRKFGAPRFPDRICDGYPDPAEGRVYSAECRLC